ncbi:MAG: Lpg1974 family pore-forming outer membrane protein [Planctomycetota bacterium]|jgi:hypothetical protein
MRRLVLLLAVAVAILLGLKETRSEQPVYDASNLFGHTRASFVDNAWQPTPAQGPAATEPSDDDSYCDPGASRSCCGPCWRVYGDLLLLRPGSDKVSYAVPIDGAIVPPVGAPPVQVGPEVAVDTDYDLGFRIGFGRTLDACSELGASFTYFEASTGSQTTGTPAFPLRSLVAHPGSVATPTNFLTATARHIVDFQLVDVDYRRLLSCGPRHVTNYVVGLRYGHLGQQFESEFTNATTIETVSTEIGFDGGGIGVGLEGERHADCGLLLYGRGAATFLAGSFRTSYLQGDNARGNVVNAGWREDGVVSILDLELGLGWTCPSRCWRLTGGYLFSGWYNTVKTDEFIQTVRTNNSVSPGDTITFDGLVARVEYRF